MTLPNCAKTQHCWILQRNGQRHQSEANIIKKIELWPLKSVFIWCGNTHDSQSEPIGNISYIRSGRERERER